MLPLPNSKSTGSESNSLVSMDDLPLWFSKALLFPSIPHLKDLFELLTESSQSGRRMSMTSSAKKVRPNTVTNLGSMDSRFVSRLSFNADNITSPWSSKRPITPNNKGGIQERLVDSFFHQHKDLQQLCQMIVDHAVKNFSEKATQQCILPIFQFGATSFEEYFNKTPIMTQVEYSKLLKELDLKACKDASSLMKDEFDRIIKGTLHLLAPPQTKTKVAEVAASLTISHASQKGTNAIHSIIGEEKKKLLEEFNRKEKKVKAGVPLTSSKKDQGGSCTRNSTTRFDTLTALIESLRAFNDLDENDKDMLETLKQEKAKVMDNMQKCFIDSKSPTIHEFELQIISMLDKFFPNPSQIYLLQAIIESIEVWAYLGKLGLASQSNRISLESLLCDADHMLALVRNSDTLGEPIGNFLFMLIDGSLVSHRALEKALMLTLEVDDGAKVASSIMLRKLLVPGTAEDSNTMSGPLVMVRLQKRLQTNQT